MLGIFPDSDDEDKPSTSTKGKVECGETALSGGGFNINKNYAERYDNWRNKEELMKMKARFGTTNPDEISDSEESSEEEEEWTEDKEKQFFKTLSNLKKKDPKIYDPTVRFFNEEETQTSTTTSKKDGKQDKPFLLKDHERTMILEKGALISDDEDQGGKDMQKPESLSYYQELDSIRKGFSKVLDEIGSDEEGGEGVLLKKGKIKTEDEKVKEEEDYRDWLQGKLERIESGKVSKEEQKELYFLRNYWSNDKLGEEEKFLRDYILNRSYIEEENKLGKHEEKEFPQDNSDEDRLSNDEDFETQMEEFEHKYNFRFEEPDQEFIKRFPRTIEDSLRREDGQRKKNRETARNRRIEAKDRKREEVQRLKALKRKEISQKLQQLQEVVGNSKLPIENLDIDGDFDPKEYDKRMKAVFNEQYYDENVDDKKPEFPYDPDLDDEVNWEEWVPSKDEENHSIEENPGPSTKSKKVRKEVELSELPDDKKELNFVGVASLNLKVEELIDGTKSRKNKSVFIEALEKKKPKFNPEFHKSFEEYFKEYYALDFEDLIGDLPCRFKYRKVQANDFGLSTKEILSAPDNELNQWASLKKTYQYRPEEEEKYEAQAYKKKAQNEKLKKKVLPSVYQKEENADDEQQKKREAVLDEPSLLESKKKKSKKKKKMSQSTSIELEKTDAVAVKQENIHKTKNDVKLAEKTNSKKRKLETEVTTTIEDERLEAYGLNPKKFKKWVKYGGKQKQN